MKPSPASDDEIKDCLRVGAPWSEISTRFRVGNGRIKRLRRELDAEAGFGEDTDDWTPPTNDPLGAALERAGYIRGGEHV